MTFEQLYIEVMGKIEAQMKELDKHGKQAKKYLKEKDMAAMDKEIYEMAKLYIDMIYFQPLVHSKYPQLIELFDALKKEYDEIERVKFMEENHGKPL